MTPEEEKASIREVQRLIDGERNPEKMKVLAPELNRLLNCASQAVALK